MVPKIVGVVAETSRNSATTHMVFCDYAESLEEA